MYVAYTHALSHKWKFLLRTIPNIGDLLTGLETAVCHSLIPSITGKNDLNNHMRRIMALPACLGGLGLDDPWSESKFEYSASRMSSTLRIDSPTIWATELRHIPQVPAKRKMRRRSEEHMIREFERLSMAHSYPPCFRKPQGALAQRPKCSMEDWHPPSSVRSSSNHTAQ